MGKMKLRRRMLSILLAVCMMIPCLSIESYATVDNTEPSKEGTECLCEVKCTEGNINEECASCKADYAVCAGEDKAAVNVDEPANGETHIHGEDAVVSYEECDATYHIKKVTCNSCPEGYVDETGEEHSTEAEGDRIPNCVSKGYCTVCKREYGAIIPDAHNVVDGKCTNTNCDYIAETVQKSENIDNGANDNGVIDRNAGDKGVTNAIDNGVGDETCEHVDEQKDGTCDTCGATVEYYSISAKSWLLGSDKNVSVANISVSPSDGYVKAGDSVTVTAQDNMLGYKFNGWYLSGDIENNQLRARSAAQSTSVSYTYTPDSNVDLFAVYEADGEATVTFRGGDFQVSVDGSDPVDSQNGEYSKAHPIGTEITIIVAEKENGFLDWCNENNKIVTTKNVYTFTVTGDVALTMGKAGAAGTAVVEFVSAYKQVIARDSYNTANLSPDKIQIPVGPSKVGYTFSKWSLTKAEIYNQIAAEGKTRITVIPVYTQGDGTYDVTVYINGNIDGEKSETGVKPGTSMLIEADSEIEGQKFSYWTDAGGNILGYNTSYAMQINSDVTIKAVYGAESITKQPMIVMTNKYITNEAGNNKISFSATRNIPEGYELVEHGMIANRDGSVEATPETFVLGTEGVTKFTATTTTPFGVYTLTVNMTGNEEQSVVARGYLIVRNKEGRREIYYTDVISDSYTNINGCVHEFAYQKVDDSNQHKKICSKDNCGYTETETHTLIYYVVDETIRVYCDKGCGYKGDATLSVTDKKCTDNNSVVVAEVDKTGALENEDIVISYVRKDGASVVGTPDTYGTYIASITLGGVTASAEFSISHADGNRDGKCDKEGCADGAIAYIITPTSVLFDSEANEIKDTGIAKLTMNPSEGYVIVGDEVKVTAPDMLGYTFKGWYLVTGKNIEINPAQIQESNKKAATFSYRYKPEEDTTLVAVYEAVGKATVTFTGSNFTVTGGDVNVTVKEVSEERLEFPLGTTVTITVTDPDFINWCNENGKIVIKEETQTITVTGDMTLKMNKQATDDNVKVEFVSAYNQIIASETYKKDEAETADIQIPPGPSKMGYEFIRWSLTKEEIRAKMSEEGVNQITVTPVYQLLTTTYDVNVYVDGVKDEKLSETGVLPGTSMLLTAPTVNERKFLYWTDESGTVLGYDTSYGIQVNNKDITIKAVYGKETVEVVKKPAIVMTNMYRISEAGNNKIVFSVTRNIPEGYELVEHGMIAKKNGLGDLTEDAFVLGASGVTKFTATTTTTSGVYTLTVNMTNSESVEVAARGYLIVRNSQDDKEEIYYTEVISDSYNGKNTPEQ